jgi:hypothetical protein
VQANALFLPLVHPSEITLMSASQQPNSRIALIIVLGLILLAICGRFLPFAVPQLGNFTPVAAVALFAGCTLQNHRIAMLVPLIAMLISDAVIGFHGLVFVVYGCLALTAYLGQRLQQASGTRVLGYALLSSLIFFVVTNTAVWLQGGLYPMTLAGLRDCYIAAIPFWRNELLGTLSYSAALFGSYALLRARYPRLALA